MKQGLRFAIASAALLGMSAPALANHDRGYDPADPRFGRAVGDAMSDMIGVLGRAVNDARHSVRLPGNSHYRGVHNRDAAVDVCARAAEDEALRVSHDARVVEIDDIDSYRDDSWDVEGRVVLNDEYREGRSGERRFTCSVRYGQVEHVHVDGTEYAYRY